MGAAAADNAGKQAKVAEIPATVPGLPRQFIFSVQCVRYGAGRWVDRAGAIPKEAGAAREVCANHTPTTYRGHEKTPVG